MRDKLVPVAVALLCIVALGLGAAAMAGTLGDDGDSSAPPTFDGTQTGNDSSAGGGPTAEESDRSQQQAEVDDECLAGFDQIQLTWVVVALTLGVTGLVFVHTRELMAGVMAFPLVLFPLLFGLVVLIGLLGCPVPGEGATQAGEVQNETVESFGELFDYTDEDQEQAALYDRLRLGGFFLAFLAVAILMGFYIKRQRSGDHADEAVTDLREGADTELATVAGDAADEVAEASEAENGVYRAWVAMTEVLDVDHPETSTPREFADAALEAGIDSADVSELTALFEEVRYGTTPVTADHEQQAQETLRRIERRYSDGDLSDEGQAGDGREWGEQGTQPTDSEGR